MDRDFESKIDEISGAFERWAKEVADRIVDAAKSGAESAANSHEATKSRSSYCDPSTEDDPWLEWARMRDETWERWARGKFDKSLDADALRRIYQDALNRVGSGSVIRVLEGLFRQLEQVLRTAGEVSGDANPAQPCSKLVGTVDEFVDVEIEVVNDRRTQPQSDYARALIAKIDKLDRKGKSNKKMIKSLLVDLEADLKKLNKKSGKGKKK